MRAPARVCGGCGVCAAGGGQLTTLKDLPARLLTWWYKSVVDKSAYDSMPVRIWQWLTHNVIKHEMLK